MEDDTQDVAALEFRNPVENPFGGIDCEVNHPKYGWIPFTASPDDPEEYGRATFEKAKSSASPMDLGWLASVKADLIDEEYQREKTRGFPYSFNGVDDIVQTRENDVQNLMNIRSRAQSGDDQIPFRAKSNEVYTLSSSEAIAMVSATLAHLDDLMLKSWSLKDQIASAAASGDKAAIEAIAW